MENLRSEIQAVSPQRYPDKSWPQHSQKILKAENSDSYDRLTHRARGRIHRKALQKPHRVFYYFSTCFIAEGQLAWQPWGWTTLPGQLRHRLDPLRRSFLQSRRPTPKPSPPSCIDTCWGPQSRELTRVKKQAASAVCSWRSGSYRFLGRNDSASSTQMSSSSGYSAASLPTAEYSMPVPAPFQCLYSRPVIVWLWTGFQYR